MSSKEVENECLLGAHNQFQKRREGIEREREFFFRVAIKTARATALSNHAKPLTFNVRMRTNSLTLTSLSVPHEARSPEAGLKSTERTGSCFVCF